MILLYEVEVGEVGSEYDCRLLRHIKMRVRVEILGCSMHGRNKINFLVSFVRVVVTNLWQVIARE